MSKFHTNPMGDYSKNWERKRRKNSVFYHKKRKKKKGCYVATCVYGSYDCPEVWTLRRYRDYVLEKTWYGRAFIRIYYMVSPAFVRLFGKTNCFQTICKRNLDSIVVKLQKKGYKDTPYDDKY